MCTVEKEAQEAALPDGWSKLPSRRIRHALGDGHARAVLAYHPVGYTRVCGQEAVRWSLLEDRRLLCSTGL